MIISSQTLSLYHRERAIALAKAGLDDDAVSGLEEEGRTLAKIVRCSQSEGASQRNKSFPGHLRILDAGKSA
jgi:hypothetical protein